MKSGGYLVVLTIYLKLFNMLITMVELAKISEYVARIMQATRVIPACYTCGETIEKGFL